MHLLWPQLRCTEEGAGPHMWGFIQFIQSVFVKASTPFSTCNTAGSNLGVSGNLRAMVRPTHHSSGSALINAINKGVMVW